MKLVKGTVFSYPEDELVREAASLISQGAKEIWLTSTDNAAYGRDAKTTLPSLIRRLSSLPGDFKIRLGMMNPLLTKRDLEDLVECLRLDKVFKFLHLPVQSGSDRILKVMQRGYTNSEFEVMVDQVRRAVPEITLSTDIIVGFPTETEEEFRESMALVERVKPDVLNLSRFGARSGTKAAAMEGQISSQIAKKRSSLMTGLSKRIQNERNRGWIGWKGPVLVDEQVRGAVIGRNFAYKPCLIRSDFGVCPLGSEVDVEVTDATASTLRAIPITRAQTVEIANYY